MLAGTCGVFEHAALAGGNGAAMGAGAGMAEERTDAVCGFGGENMLEPACLLRYFVFVLNTKGMHEQALGEAMATDNVFRAFAAFFGKQDHMIAMAGESCAGTQGIVTAVEHLFMRMGFAGVLFHLHQPQFL